MLYTSIKAIDLSMCDLRGKQERQSAYPVRDKTNVMLMLQNARSTRFPASTDCDCGKVHAKHGAMQYRQTGKNAPAQGDDARLLTTRTSCHRSSYATGSFFPSSLHCRAPTFRQS